MAAPLPSPLALLPLLTRVRRDRAGLLAELTMPVLVWTPPAAALGDDEDEYGAAPTVVMAPGHAGAGGTATQVFLVRKDATKRNAFAMGVTVGRLVTNDVVLELPSVSRFHAWLQQDPKSGRWAITDAGSDNGTVVAGRRLAQGQPAPLSSGDSVTVGAATLRFFLPPQFVAWLESGGKG